MSVCPSVRPFVRAVSTFLPRDAMHKRGLSRHAVSVCLCVRVSVTFVNSVKTNKHIVKFFAPLGDHNILVLQYQTSWQYSDGDRVVECKWYAEIAILNLYLASSCAVNAATGCRCYQHGAAGL